MTEETKPLYLNIKTNVEGTDACGKLRNKFDLTISGDGNMLKDGIPAMYKFLYEYYKVLYTTVKNRPLITMSHDTSISMASVAGVSEKYLKLTSENDKPKYVSTMKILYIDSRPDIEDTSEIYANRVVSNLMCIDNVTLTKHKTVINPDQIIYLGLNDDCMTDFDIDMLKEYGSKYFTLKNIRTKKLQDIMDNIVESFGESPVYVVFDMSACAPSCAPCVFRPTMSEKMSGLHLDEIIGITKSLSKMNVVGLDITGYDLRIDDKNLGFRVTCETVQIIIKHIFNVTEKRINIFNEHTRFLIWRSVSDEDVGWHILRNVPLDIRESLLDRLKDDDIILFELPNENEDSEYEDVYISSTTIAEQEEKSYSICEDGDFVSCTLYPEDKVSMLFELLNA